MEFKTLGHIPSVEVYMPIGDEIIIEKNSFFETYRKDDMKLIDQRVDYMGVPMLIVEKDCPYIIELTPLRRIKIRDRKTKDELCSKGMFFSGFVPFRGCISLDKKHIYIALTRPGDEILPPYFVEEIKATYDFVLAEFSLPDLEMVKIIECEGVRLNDIFKVDFMDKYIVQTSDNRYVLLDEYDNIENITFPCYKDVDEKIMINNYRHEFYTKTPNGIKVLNEHFQEQDSILFFDNEEVEVDNTYITTSVGGRNDRFSKKDLTSFRLYLRKLKVLNENVLIYTINDVGTTSTTLMAYCFDTKKSYKLLDIAVFVESFKTYGNVIAFSERHNLHVLEVENG